jgi:hypothetical protein
MDTRAGTNSAQDELPTLLFHNKRRVQSVLRCRKNRRGDSTPDIIEPGVAPIP